MKTFIGTEVTEVIQAVAEDKMQKITIHNLSIIDLNVDVWIEDEQGVKSSIREQGESAIHAARGHANYEFSIKTGGKLLAKAEKEDSVIIEIIDFTKEELEIKITQIEKRIQDRKLEGIKMSKEISSQVQQYETGILFLEEDYIKKKQQHRDSIASLTANKVSLDNSILVNEENDLKEIEMYRSQIKP